MKKQMVHLVVAAILGFSGAARAGLVLVDDVKFEPQPSVSSPVHSNSAGLADPSTLAALTLYGLTLLRRRPN